MSVALNMARKSELPLILFTTCVPAAEGVALCSLFLGGGLLLAGCCWLLASIGMAASIAHLARPLRAPRALANLKSSWLSREILAVGVFWGLLLAWAFACLLGWDLLALLANEGAAILGVPLLWIIARAYKVSTRPAWRGPEGLGELWACVLGSGTALSLACVAFPSLAVGEAFAPSDAFPFVACGLSVAAISGLGIDLWSHMSRRERLENMRDSADERISLTLANYAKLWPMVKKAWLAEALCLVAFVAAAVFANAGDSVVSFWLTAAVSAGQLLVHGTHRNLFYEVPIQVRWVAKLRK